MKKIKILSNHGNKQTYFINIVTKILLVLIAGILILIQFLRNDKFTLNEMNFITNKGNIIYTEYKDLGNFSIKIPKDFETMSEDILQVKYPTSNRPKLVYTNKDATINIAFNEYRHYLTDKKLSEYIDLVKSELNKKGYSVYSFDFEVDGLKLYTLTLNTQAIDTTIYNYMVIFSIDEEIIFINFNCIDKYTEEWSEVAKFIIQSIRVK